METMLTRLFSKILRFINVMLITIITEYYLIIGSCIRHTDNLQADDHNILTSKIFKYNNVMFNLNNVTTIHYFPSLVGYMLTSLNRTSWTPQSMTAWQWVNLSNIITNKMLLQLMCTVATNLFQLIPYVMTHLTFMMVLHVPRYLLAQSHWFQMHMV